MEEETKTIRAQWQRLPNKLRQTVRSQETAQLLQTIAERYNFSKEQERALSNEVYLALMGLESPGDFLENVQRELQIPVETGISLSKEVNEQIFQPVAESLETFTKQQLAAEEHSGQPDAPLAEREPQAVAEHAVRPTSTEPQSAPQRETQTNERPSSDVPDADPADTEPNVPQSDQQGQRVEEKKYPGNVDPYREPIE